jgi:twitching motility protein PilT
VRINGRLRPVPDQNILKREDVREFMGVVLSDRQIELFQDTHDLDCSYEVDGVARFRVNVFLQRQGEAIAFRLIPAKIRGLAELGMPVNLSDLCKIKQGLVLVTGPTGSGKTTTLAAMLDIANTVRHDHIVTIEDPIEYVHNHKNCIVNQREVGSHTASFAIALRSALREDPDVILVGEMRDLETISLAVTAAETGHLVFATLHTNSVAESVDRVVDVFPAHQQQQIRTQLAGSLAAIISQRLLPRCDTDGRVAAYEVMLANSGIRALIREGKSEQILSMIQTGGAVGMNTMDSCLRRLLNEGKISLEEAHSHAHNKMAFQPPPEVPAAKGSRR